jgi:hypothetical protein
LVAANNSAQPGSSAVRAASAACSMSATLQPVGGGSGVRAPRRWPQGLLRSPAGLGVVVWSVSLRRSLRDRLAPVSLLVHQDHAGSPPVELVWPACGISGFGSLQAGTIKVGALKCAAEVRLLQAREVEARPLQARAAEERRARLSIGTPTRCCTAQPRPSGRPIMSCSAVMSAGSGSEGIVQWPSHRKSADRRRSPRNAGSACCSCTASVSSRVRLGTELWAVGVTRG